MPRRAGAGRAVPRGHGNGLTTGQATGAVVGARVLGGLVDPDEAPLDAAQHPDTVAFVSLKPSEPARSAADTPAGSIRVQVHVPADRVVRLPPEIPEGPAELIVIPRTAATAEARRAAFGRYDGAGFTVPDDFNAPLPDEVLTGF